MWFRHTLTPLERFHSAYKAFVERRHPVCNSILIGLAVVLFWRGMWGVLDLYLFPGNEHLSYIVSTLLGVLVLLLYHGGRRLKELE